MDFELTSSYDYALPDELIADVPVAQRSGSRLMAADTTTGSVAHLSFAQLPDLLRANDLVVLNDTRVVSARILGHKSSGGAVELFVVDVAVPQGPDRWSTPADTLELRCMTRASKPLREGQEIHARGRVFRVVAAEAGMATVTISSDGRSADALLQEVGEVPLPPYIVRRRSEIGSAPDTGFDAQRYQTVYAAKPGAVAAPTAGLHFDRELFDRLDERGVSITTLTLDVGPGTFRPVTATTLAEHEMHHERYAIGPHLGPAIAASRAAGGRVIAVGTTCVRALEAEALRDAAFEPGDRTTGLFIKPGFEFRVVDALVTNFHLPRSTLLALVYAFGGPDLVRRMYETAVRERYRFYSYGDAMFLGHGQ